MDRRNVYRCNFDNSQPNWRCKQLRALLYVSLVSTLLNLAFPDGFGFSREVIKQKNDIHDGIGWPDWELSLWLLLSWIAVYLVIVKGVKSSGKASYFLAIFPYVVMFILLGRAVTLEGAWDGIKFFITPDFKRLWEPQVRTFVMGLKSYWRIVHVFERSVWIFLREL